MKDEKTTKKKYGTILRTKDKTTPKELLEAVFYSVCAYLFGCAETIFETYPFGIAFMCSVRRHVPFAISGVMLSCLVCDAPIASSFCGCFASAAFRYGMSYVTDGKDNFELFTLKDTVLCRICSAGVGTLTVSVLRFITDGASYYGLFAIVVCVFLGAFMTYVYSLVFDCDKKYTQKYEAGLGAVFFTFVIALRSVGLFGISAGAVCAFLFPIYTARSTGVMRGTVIGLLCGLALDATISPAFAALGFVCGLIPRSAVYSTVTVPCAVSLSVCYLLSGADAVFPLLSEAVLASAVYVPLERFRLLPPLFVFNDSPTYHSAVSVERIADSCTVAAYRRELTSLSRSLEGISEVMCALSDKEKRPAVHEICEVCEKELSSFCKKCSMKKLCFPDGIRGSHHIRESACRIYEKGVLSTSDLPEKIKTGCYFADKLTVNVNIRLAEYNSEKLKNNKTEVMAEDFIHFSRFIDGITLKRRTEDTVNEALTEQLRKTTVYRDLFGNNLAVYGSEDLTVIACGVDSKKIKTMSGEIQRNFSRSLGVTLGKGEFTYCDGFTAVIYKRKEKYVCSPSSLQAPKDGESINGDSTFSFVSDGKFYTCICDGMGSGHAAALTSKLASVFLQKLLSCGADAEIVMKTLNHFIRSKSGECFTTVDIMCVDLLTGGGSFIKSGAAPSYVIREGRIFRMASLTPPVGIMSELCSERIDFVFKNGDIAVMVSDGVADTSDELVWLYNLLTYESDCPTSELCEKIMERSSTEHLGQDDMTVCAVAISSV